MYRACQCVVGSVVVLVCKAPSFDLTVQTLGPIGNSYCFMDMENAIQYQRMRTTAWTQQHVYCRASIHVAVPRYINSDQKFTLYNNTQPLNPIQCASSAKQSRDEAALNKLPQPLQ